MALNNFKRNHLRPVHLKRVNMLCCHHPVIKVVESWLLPTNNY